MFVVTLYGWSCRRDIAARAGWGSRSKLASLSACQTPFKFGWSAWAVDGRTAWLRPVADPALMTKTTAIAPIAVPINRCLRVFLDGIKHSTLTAFRLAVRPRRRARWLNGRGITWAIACFHFRHAHVCVQCRECSAGRSSLRCMRTHIAALQSSTSDTRHSRAASRLSDRQP
jgi:hypothetical protein